MEDDFYCAIDERACGADVPIYRFVKHSLNGPQYTYSFDRSDISGFQREFKPICYGWGQSPSVVVYNSSQALCMQLEEVKKGEIVYSTRSSHVYPVGTMASLMCQAGYSGVGQSHVLCTQKGWYPKIGLGLCQQAQKADLQRSVSSGSSSTAQQACILDKNLANGTIIYSGHLTEKEVSSNTRASVVCNIGFTPSSPITSSKCVDGQWIPALPTCLSLFQLSCPILSEPENGKITFLNQTQPSYSVSSTVELKCDKGFYNLGNTTATCTPEGWSRNLGTCESIAFGSVCTPLAVTNGNIIYAQGSMQTNYSSGTTAFLMCNYSLPSGSSSSYCSNGTWVPPIGTCIPISPLNSGSSGQTCSSLPIPFNGMVNYSPISFVGQHNAGTVANLSCHFGFSVSGSLTSTCSNGNWSPPSLGNCTYVGQMPLSDVTTSVCLNPMVFGGQLSYSQGSSFETTKPQGSIATLSCPSGYTLSGTASATCQSNGQWSPTLGTCTFGSAVGTGTSCAAILSPLGGNVSYSGASQVGPFTSGTVVSLVCSGTLPQGASSATCSNGQWNPPSLGICTPSSMNPFNNSFFSQNIQCTAMFPPFGGTVTYSTGSTMGPFMSGTTATASCVNGGLISGSSTATCSGGMWNPAFFGFCPMSNSNSATCSQIILPTGATATYSSGGNTATHASGTVATVACSNGIILALTTCLSGIWSPPLNGSCTAGGTGTGTSCSTALAAPLNGYLTYNSGQISPPFNNFAIATLNCNMGFTVSGHPSATCLNGQWSPSSVGTCGGTSTGTGCNLPITAPLGGYVTYSTGQTIGPFAQFTVATGRCNSSQVTSSATCQNGVWNPTMLTSCSGASTTTCAAPQVPTGASVTFSPAGFTYSSGTVATLTCPGSSATTSTCFSGSWVPAIVCAGTSNGQCQQPPTSSSFGATFTYSNGAFFGPWSSGTTATMSCPSGGQVNGLSTATCISGSWTTLGTCSTSSSTGSGCAPFGALTTTLANGTLNYTPALNTTVPIGSLATVTCFSGYVISGAASSVCTVSGWQPTSLGSCSPINGALTTSTCLFTAPIVLNAVTTYSNGQRTGPFPSGTIATTTCNSNFLASGSLTTTCLNGGWSPSTLGTCNPLPGNNLLPGTIGCAPLPTVLFGTILYSSLSSGTYPSGTSASLLCNLGYRTSGPTIATCTNGLWSPSVGVCVAASLMRLPPTNITMTKVDRVRNGTEILIANQTMDDEGPGLCPPPIAPAFGEITFSSKSTNGTFESGTTAALKCALGYNSAGATFSTCSKGSFRPILGSCISGDEPPRSSICMPLAPPRNARITYIQTGRSLDFEDDTTALLYCEEGFAVTGTATLQCKSGTWHPPTGFGTCDESNIVRRR